MSKTLADYTEAEFTKWVDEIINYGRTDDTTGFNTPLIDYVKMVLVDDGEMALADYVEVVGEPAALDFVQFMATVIMYKRSLKFGNEENGLVRNFVKFMRSVILNNKDAKNEDDVPYILPDAKDVVAGVKAWCLDNKVPCFCADMLDSPVKLSRQELYDLVSKMLGDGPITQEDINLFHHVAKPFGAPDFLDVPEGTPAEQIADHICQWHAIYRKTTFS